MNDKNILLGKRIVTNTAVVGKIVSVNSQRGEFVMLREDGRGWKPSASKLQMILAETPGITEADCNQRCWYVAPHQILGVLYSVHDLPQPRVDQPQAIPATPVEPTAPMTAQVLKMLRKKGDVTSIEAAGVLRCRSLSKRISELRRLGHRIARTLHEDHTGQRYARYTLAA